jgi:hypothetical protein
MRRTHLGVQAAIVLTMVTFVSWPQFRPVRAQSVWRYAPAAVLEARANDAARFAGDRAAAGAAARHPIMGVDQTAFTGAKTTAPNPLAQGQAGSVFYTPAEVASLGGKLNALVGMARTSLNVPIAYAQVVLRNIRTGQVLGRTTANEQGQFSFLDLDSNPYLVELLGPDGAVVAASQMVTVARGDVRQTEVRVAAAAATIVKSLGSTTAPTIQQATTTATRNDVTRTTPTLTTQESPR